MTSPPRTSPGSSIGWGQPDPPPGPARRPRRRGRLLLALGLVTSLVLGAVLAGGWHFAGQIHADALRVDPWEPQYGQSIARVGDGTVTISDPADEQPALDRPHVWGIQWRSGYGQVHGPGSNADEVTRDFTLVSGRPPRADEVIAVDRSAFPFDDPAAALGQPVRDVVYGPRALPAWFVPGEGTTWAILVHGKGGTRAEMLRMMRTTVAAGLPSLAIGYRNDLGVARDPSDIYQFGRTERDDLAAAVQYAQRQGATDVVLVGASMGGAISVAYLEQAANPPVRGLFLDAPMLDFGETVAYGAEQRPLPLLGSVPAPVTWTAKQLATLRWGIDWDAVDYLDDTAWLTVPTLVVHGEDDLTVPLRTSEELVAAHPDLVDLAVFKGAGHVASWNSDPDRYDALLADFLAKVTSN